MRNEKVAILGASNNKERYSNKAQRQLLNAGHEVFPINPKLEEVDGIKCIPIEKLKNIDTLTLYVTPKISSSLQKQILKLAPKRVIFNPGTENDQLENELEKSNIQYEKACTLVLLSTKQF